MFECVCISSSEERNREIAEDGCTRGDFHNRVCELRMTSGMKLKVSTESFLIV